VSGEIVFVAGSPSSSSRSSYVADAIAAHARAGGLAVRAFSLRDFDASDVLLARVEAPAVAGFVAAAKSAAAIVLSTPVYKATYAGGLKALVDLIPHDALTGKAALGVATTRLPDHGPSVERAYAALFGFFQARALDPVVVVDAEFEKDPELQLSRGARERVDAAARSLIAAVRQA
jgi:FMN reductase